MNTQQEQFEKTVHIFISSIENYFLTLTGTPISTNAPYVKEQDEVILNECTGMIGVSGLKMGFIYISGEFNMYENLIKNHVGFPNPKEKEILDMAGELSNVVSGNVRETYGDEFMISVPIVFRGKPEALRFPGDVPIYVIPFTWKDYQAHMVLGIK